MNSEVKRKVADVLAGWNPVGVPAFLAYDEYESYIEPLITIGNNRAGLSAYLKELLTRTFELPYNEEEVEHREDVAKVVGELLEILQEGR